MQTLITRQTGKSSTTPEARSLYQAPSGAGNEWPTGSAMAQGQGGYTRFLTTLLRALSTSIA